MLLIGFLIYFCSCQGQSQEPIILLDGAYYKGDVPLKVSTIKKIVKVYPTAFQEVKGGRSRIVWGYVCCGFGGAALGSGVGSLVFGQTEDSLDPLTGIGGGILLGGLGYFLVSSGARKFTNGIEIYNSKLSTGMRASGFSVKIGPTLHGFGLTLTL